MKKLGPKIDFLLAWQIRIAVAVALFSPFVLAGPNTAARIKRGEIVASRTAIWVAAC